jgi:two-component system chemotaxis sensor kinase CheA
LQVDESGWMETFLKPALEASGYRCVTALMAGETAAVALAMEDSPVGDTLAPVVTLRRSRAAGGDDDASVYRYDRPALIAAIAARRGL